MLRESAPSVKNGKIFPTILDYGRTFHLYSPYQPTPGRWREDEMSGLADLLAAIRDDDDAPRDPSLTDAQIVTRLSEVVALAAEEQKFSAGQVVLHKFPSSATVKLASKPGVFVRYLEKPIFAAACATEPQHLFSNAAAETLDCVIACMAGEKVAFYLQPSAHYRPHPDFRAH